MQLDRFENIGFRATPQERLMVLELCKAEGRKISEYLRELIRREYKVLEEQRFRITEAGREALKEQ